MTFETKQYAPKLSSSTPPYQRKSRQAGSSRLFPFTGQGGRIMRSPQGELQ
ncbi:hypothetical protein OKW28_008235 [Paraburkholderia sp. 40]